MPDYSKPPVLQTDTPFFRGWITGKGYAWPPHTETNRKLILIEFQREMCDTKFAKLAGSAEGNPK